MLSPGEDDTGRTTAEIIQDDVHHPARCAILAQQFGISALLDRRFKYLSTGETRKALLCQALMSEPELLILDEPFDGLDVTARQQLAQRLTALNQAGMTLALVLNRFDEIPDFVQFAGVLADCTLAETGTTAELLQRALVAQLAHSERLTDVQLPEPDEPSARHALPDGGPLQQRSYAVRAAARKRRNNLGYQKTYRLRQQQFTSGLPRQYHGTQCHSLRLFRFYRHLPGRFRQATKTGATVAGYSGNR